MHRSLPPVSDEDLHALVDGEIDPARRDAIFSFLSASPADAAKVDVWRRQNEAIRASFARLDGEPLVLAASPAASGEKGGALCRLRDKGDLLGAGAGIEGSSQTGWRQRFAISGLLTAFAGGVGLTVMLVFLVGHVNLSASFDTSEARQEKDDAFVNRAKLASLNPPAKGDPASQSSISGSSPSALVLPNLSGSGLRLTGVKMAAGDRDPMICLFYAKAPSGSLALCAEKAGDGGAEGFPEAAQSAQRTVWWRQKRARYAVSGSLPEAELRAFADRARSEIDAFDAR